MGKSCAENAYGWQGLKKDKFGSIVDDSFPGHDRYQNGIIVNGSDSTIYCTKWYDGQPGSGYFTDQQTVDSCSQNGILNSNKLGEALQTAPSNYGTNGGAYQHKPNCTAYDINWDKINSLKESNPELHEKLTNPDGLSPNNTGIKCAYGRAEANPQYGAGGGNQYYIEKDTFNESVKEGVFSENPNKSFSEEKGNLSRHDITNDATFENNMATIKGNVICSEESKEQPTSSQINSFEVKEEADRPFIAQPDSAYGYSQDNNTNKVGNNDANIEASHVSNEYLPHGPPGTNMSSHNNESISKTKAPEVKNGDKAATSTEPSTKDAHTPNNNQSMQKDDATKADPKSQVHQTSPNSKVNEQPENNHSNLNEAASKPKDSKEAENMPNAKKESPNQTNIKSERDTSQSISNTQQKTKNETDSKSAPGKDVQNPKDIPSEKKDIEKPVIKEQESKSTKSKSGSEQSVSKPEQAEKSALSEKKNQSSENKSSNTKEPSKQDNIKQKEGTDNAKSGGEQASTDSKSKNHQDSPHTLENNRKKNTERPNSEEKGVPATSSNDKHATASESSPSTGGQVDSSNLQNGNNSTKMPTEPQAKIEDVNKRKESSSKTPPVSANPNNTTTDNKNQASSIPTQSANPNSEASKGSTMPSTAGGQSAGSANANTNSNTQNKDSGRER